MNSERKNCPMKEFRAIFPISSISVISPRMWNKVSFQTWLYFKLYGIYINLGCRFEFRMQKLPYERISGNFSDFIDFGHTKQGHFSILAIFKNVWDLHNFGLQIWIQNAKITLWKKFWSIFQISSILVIRPETRSFLIISCILKCMGFT